LHWVDEKKPARVRQKMFRFSELIYRYMEHNAGVIWNI